MWRLARWKEQWSTATTLPGVVEASTAVVLLVLAAAGVSKVIDPTPTAGALSASGLPSGIWLVRLLGLAELTLAVAGLLFGGVVLGIAALAHLGFLGFTISSMRRAMPLQSCGCFGREDTPPSRIHVAYNVLAAVVLAAAAAGGSPPVPSGAQPLDTILFVGFAALGGYATILVLTRLPVLLSLMRTR